MSLRALIITGEARNTQKWQYPLEAIREIIMNMIVHRDYCSSSDSIVKVFNNKIEFYNPGRLPDNITIEDLLANNYKSCPRNKLIADFCKNIGLIEKYGSGIRRVISYFENENLPRPDFRNISDGFMVTIYGKSIEDVGKELTGSIKEVYQLLLKRPELTIPEIATLTGYTQRTIGRNLSQLKELYLIKRSGGREEGRWIIIRS